MSPENENVMVLQGGQISEFIAELTTKAILAALLLVILYIIQIFRNGVTSRYLFLIFGAIFSVVALIAYSLLITLCKGSKQKSWSKSLVAMGGFIPYLYGCYLVFYEGLYRLRFLLHGLSFRIIIVACLFIILGYAIVNSIYRISEFGRLVNEGKIIIE